MIHRRWAFHSAQHTAVHVGGISGGEIRYDSGDLRWTNIAWRKTNIRVSSEIRKKQPEIIIHGVTINFYRNGIAGRIMGTPRGKSPT